MTIPFLKMQGAANDFVVIDHRRPILPEDEERRAALLRRMCDRRRGVGADGVLLLERSAGVDFAMRYFNADGLPADFCGNGARCLARLALDLGLGNGEEVRFETAAGIQHGRHAADGRAIELLFGTVEAARPVERVAALDRSFAGRRARTGVPHFVVPVERVQEVPVREWGAALRRHAAFGEAGTNVDFVARLGPGRIAMRTYERGVEDETLACGSGAMASALWAVAEGDRAPVTVVTAGGDELTVALSAAGPAANGVERYEVRLTGPAEVAFRGEWTEGAPLAAVRR
jgi:diaminopimelate epimerase